MKTSDELWPWLTLHQQRKDGAKIPWYVNATHISDFGYSDGHAFVFVGGEDHGVIETVDEISTMLRRMGAVFEGK